MRSMSLAALFLAPALLSAQTPQTLGTSLPARTFALAAVAAPAAPVVTTTTTKSGLRVSTGVIEPKLIQRAEIKVAPSELSRYAADNKVVVSLLVDETGTPHDVAVLDASSKVLGDRAVEAVRNFRFTPAQLDAQSIPVHVNLSINFTR